ncbi:MAG: DUF4870 domain-containing protein [Euryarchaeota archaeon]|nr:DUF4870 domain-containing protein [Euryarchaeota archaeon]
MGMLVHVLAFAGLVIPLGNIIGPLVLWLVKKEEMPFVDWHGKQALNFNISIWIYGAIIGFAALVLFWTLIFPMLAMLFIGALLVFWLVMTIVNAMKASNGEWVKYPLTIEFLK